MNFKCNINVKSMTSEEQKKKLCIRPFSFNQVVNYGIQHACIINIIKIFFTIQNDFSIGKNTTDYIQEAHPFL